MQFLEFFLKNLYFAVQIFAILFQKPRKTRNLLPAKIFFIEIGRYQQPIPDLTVQVLSFVFKMKSF